MNECPGCNHGGKIVECSVYKEYGKGKHWFIHPVDGGYACDFCGEVSTEEDEIL